MREPAIFDFENPFSSRCQGQVVRDQDKGCARLPVQFKKEVGDMVAGFGVEVACRFIDEQNYRLVDKCPGNGHTLLLTSR